MGFCGLLFASVYFPEITPTPVNTLLTPYWMFPMIPQWARVCWAVLLRIGECVNVGVSVSVCLSLGEMKVYI